MLSILSLTGVIFVLIFIGFLTIKLALFDHSQMKVLTQYVVTLALPALIFKAVADNPLHDIIDPAYMLAYLFASLVAFILLYQWAKRGQHQSSLYSAFANDAVFFFEYFYPVMDVGFGFSFGLKPCRTRPSHRCVVT